MQSSIVEILILAVGIVFLIHWIRSWQFMRKTLMSLKVLSLLPQYESQTTKPTLSIIVPACNEAESLKVSVPLILAQTYPSLEIILINDRSDDDTGSVIDAFKDQDSRVKCIHIEHLPDGWLGKVNALQKGVEAASGEYYLFTDADIEFSESAFSSAIAYAEQQQADHVVVFPFNRGRRSFLLGIFSYAFAQLFINKTRLQAITNVKDNGFIGIGAFNLVKKSAFYQTPGFDWLRMEPLDDLGLGLMLHQSGFQSHVLNGLGSVEMDWYPTLWNMIKGLDKNFFSAVGHYNYLRAIWQAIIYLGTGIAPLCSAFYIGFWPLFWIALLLQCVVPGILGLLIRKQTRQNPLIGFFIPLGFVLLFFTLLRSAWVHWVRKGIIWRNTPYPSGQLKQGLKVRL